MSASERRIAELQAEVTKLRHLLSQQLRSDDAIRSLLEEFAASRHADRHVNPKYVRTAGILVRHGYLRRLTEGWYELTPLGRERATGQPPIGAITP